MTTLETSAANAADQARLRDISDSQFTDATAATASRRQ